MSRLLADIAPTMKQPAAVGDRGNQRDAGHNRSINQSVN